MDAGRHHDAQANWQVADFDAAHKGTHGGKQLRSAPQKECRDDKRNTRSKALEAQQHGIARSGVSTRCEGSHGTELRPPMQGTKPNAKPSPRMRG